MKASTFSFIIPYLCSMCCRVAFKLVIWMTAHNAQQNSCKVPPTAWQLVNLRTRVVVNWLYIARIIGVLYFVHYNFISCTINEYFQCFCTALIFFNWLCFNRLFYLFRTVTLFGIFVCQLYSLHMFFFNYDLNSIN